MKRKVLLTSIGVLGISIAIFGIKSRNVANPFNDLVANNVEVLTSCESTSPEGEAKVLCQGDSGTCTIPGSIFSIVCSGRKVF